MTVPRCNLICSVGKRRDFRQHPYFTGRLSPVADSRHFVEVGEEFRSGCLAHLCSSAWSIGLNVILLLDHISRIESLGPGQRASRCYPRQREYPHPPPPSRNNTRRTINMVVISHLFSK
jgi:hypothetical protein